MATKAEQEFKISPITHSLLIKIIPGLRRSYDLLVPEVIHNSVKFWHNFYYQIELIKQQLEIPHSITFKIEINDEKPVQKWEEIQPITSSIFKLRKSDEEILEELS